MNEATNDFHAAFILNASIAQTFVQRALILSFQRKFEDIIREFEQKNSIKKISDPTLLVLVAKAKIQCKDYSGILQY
jgi:hypothetical protein